MDNKVQEPKQRKEKVKHIIHPPLQGSKDSKSDIEDIFNKMGKLKEITNETMIIHENNEITCMIKEGMKANHVRKIIESVFVD